MKCCLLFFMLWFITPTAISQDYHPGGVKGAIRWYTTGSSADAPGLRNQIDGNAPVLTYTNASLGWLNFHPSLVTDGRHPLSINLGTHDLRSASFFTVYQVLDTAEENSIWHITNGPNTTLVLTTDRMADLSIYQYMNYKDVIREHPKVNVYVQHREKDSATAASQWWNIGLKPTTPRLPVMNFKGLVPEIIAYNRVLNSRERLQVASYLALKYGITLTEPGATYLNSAGEKVWDGYTHSAWHRNIAGICRDDSAGLYQSIAGSSNTPGLLVMATKEALANNAYLLWGDNGKALIAAPKIPGLPVLLQKTWLLKTYGNTTPFITDVIIDTKPVDVQLPVKPVYWLAIDPAAEGKFNAPATVFIKMDKPGKDGKVLFRNVVWDKDGSGKDVWGIIAAQELLLATVINQPTCTSPGTGSLQVRLLGGKAPYQLFVQNNDGLLISRRVENDNPLIHFTGLSAGKYFLKVTDAAKQAYTDSFYINNADAPLPVLIAGNYMLPAGRPLLLNAAENMPDDLSWEWSGPAGFLSYSPQVTINEPGLYRLRCTKNNCSSEQDVLVTATHNNILYDITVYPNPTQAAFNARITLDKPAPVTLAVYAPDGKLVTTQKGENRAHYLFTGELKAAGTYQLVFTSGLSKTTKRLVIVK